MRQLISGLAFFFTVFAVSFSAFAQTVPAPRGWTDNVTENLRILTKKTAIIEIWNWESLQGQTLQSVLEQRKQSVPDTAIFKSAKRVKPESSIKGAFQITRKVTLGNKNGQSVLYGCPGQPGYVRMMRMTFRDTNIFSVLSGATFLEKVCKEEFKGGSNEARPSAFQSTPSSSTTATIASQTNSTQLNNESQQQLTGRNLAAANANIPDSNRPIAATVFTDKVLRGFPAMLTFINHMMMQFPNGYYTSCVDWNPVTQEPTPQSIGSKNCELSRSKGNGSKILGFKPGARVSVAFGRISAVGVTGIGASGSIISGGDLVLTKDGRIVIGEFGVNYSRAGSSAGGVVSSGSKKKNVIGRYYLNGYTMTVETDEGEIFHTYIGYTPDKDSGAIKYVYFNDKQYWDRSE